MGSGECDGSGTASDVGAVVGAWVGSGECDGADVGAVVGAWVGSGECDGWAVALGWAVGDELGCGVSYGVTTPTWTTALAPRSPSPTITQRPTPIGVTVKFGLVPLVFTMPVQSPCSVNAPVKPGCTKMTGAGVDVTEANWRLRGVTPMVPGFASAAGWKARSTAPASASRPWPTPRTPRSSTARWP